MEGLTAFASADGVTWRKLAEKPVITKGAFDSQNVCFWSGAEGLYLCYFRISTQGVRTVARTTSKDFRTWSEPVEMGFGGAPMEHLYTNGTTPYFRAPHIYVALPGRFWPARKALGDEDAAALDVWEVSGGAEDCSDAVLMTTRGGSRYDRTFMESFVRPGLEKGNWVSRANYPAQGVVPTSPVEMSIYVGRGQHQNRAARRDRRGDRWLRTRRLRPDNRRRRRPSGHLERQRRRKPHGPAADQAALCDEGRRPLLAALPIDLGLDNLKQTRPTVPFGHQFHQPLGIPSVLASVRCQYGLLTKPTVSVNIRAAARALRIPPSAWYNSTRKEKV